MTAPTTGRDARDLARRGYFDATRSAAFLEDELLRFLPDAAIGLLGRTPDPDRGVLTLLRLLEAARDVCVLDPYQDVLAGETESARVTRSRLIAVLGGSEGLGDRLVHHPELLAALAGGGIGGIEPSLAVDAADVHAFLLEAVGADAGDDMPRARLIGTEGYDALRRSYHARLLQIAAADLSSDDPVALQPIVSAALADLADAALETALAIGRGTIDRSEDVRLAVLAMGKTGARELNYISDVDVIYVAEPVEGADEEDALDVGAGIARELARACATVTGEGSLWQVDANLRPEGKDGPLVRTIRSHRQYYADWAKNWEFQALLKARAAAGDLELGREFVDMTRPLVWTAAGRDGFVEDSRAMRRRVVANIRTGEAERNIKLGPGGLRDVEFTVQLLQLVHGRSDTSLRSPVTLTALGALRDGGYIGRADAEKLDHDYRYLRVIEHRMQLRRMRRTQVQPTAPRDVRVLARAIGVAPDKLADTVARTRREVAALHESIYYRPILTTSAALSEGQARLSPDAAKERLAAIGYLDPARAMDHIESLTRGISRRAAIQRQLLPALLEWFADGIDPDHGLLAFRRLSDVIGSSHWYLAMLRDSSVAARRLTVVLSDSRFIGDQLTRIPEAARWLSDTDTLVPRTHEQLMTELDAVLSRTDVVESGIRSVRRLRARELLRLAMAQLLDVIDLCELGAALSELAAACLDAALRVATAAVARETGDDSPRPDPGVRMAVIGLGSFGACEMGYSSDADVQFVYEPYPTGTEGAAEDPAARAIAIASRVQKLMNAPSTGPDMKVNADLRPDGRHGILARSLDSYLGYYREQAALWERQALLRARPVAGDVGLGERAMAGIDPYRFPAGGLTASGIREIRRMKARVESERLPRGADPTRHLKLGRGAMSDVEWTAQLIQLENGATTPAIRSTRTLDVLAAAAHHDLLSDADAAALRVAWLTAAAYRRALFLWKGREGAVLPKDRLDLRACAILVGGPDVGSTEAEEHYLKCARHARSVFERLFYGEHEPGRKGP